MWQRGGGVTLEELWFLLDLLELGFPLEAPAEVPGDEWGSLEKSGEPPPGIFAQHLNAGTSCHSNSALLRRGQPMTARPGEVMPGPRSPLVPLLPTLGSRARVEQAGEHEKRVLRARLLARSCAWPCESLGFPVAPLLCLSLAASSSSLSPITWVLPCPSRGLCDS